MLKLVNKGNNIILITLVIILLGSYTLGGGFYEKNDQPNPQSLARDQFEIVYPTQKPGNKNLQIGTFLIKTTIPTVTTVPIPTFIRPSEPIYDNPPTETPPDDTCPPDTIMPRGSACECLSDELRAVQCTYEIEPCQDNPDFSDEHGYPKTCTYLETNPAYGKYKDDYHCQPLCYGKPVIYLYPTKITLVDVELTIPGKIIESDPLYPNGGWKNVVAHPNGALIYQGKNYPYLYYESQVNKRVTPKKGIIIPNEELEKELKVITTKLGLIQNEQQEFLDYWLPKLSELNAKYIFFSVLTPDEKESVDHVDINPKPDTKIEFLAYFKKLDKVIPVNILKLPETPPQRIGFTSVEWGGTIDY